VTLSSGLLLKNIEENDLSKHEVNTVDQDAPKFMHGVKFVQNIDSSTNHDIDKIEGTFNICCPSHY